MPLLTRIAAAKLARKLHKKGAAGDRPSNFRDKTNVRLKPCYGKTISFTELDFSISFFFKKYSDYFETHASIIILFPSGVLPRLYFTLKWNFIKKSKLNLLSEIYFSFYSSFFVQVRMFYFIISLSFDSIKKYSPITFYFQSYTFLL